MSYLYAIKSAGRYSTYKLSMSKAYNLVKFNEYLTLFSHLLDTYSREK